MKNLTEILKKHQQWLVNSRDGERADLRDAGLRGADLRDAGLRGADLRDADLRGAGLRGADLRDAGLRGADLRDAGLRGADLRDADLRDAGLRGADLRGADLRGADLRDADLRGAGLRGADLRGANLDFSCLHLSCKTLNFKTDERIRTQLMYHVASLIKYADNLTNEEKEILEKITPYANKFCRVGNDVELL